MIDFEALLTDKEKEAITVLEAGGFLSLSDVKINDCRDLNSGKRMRTFRNRGKYDLVIAFRNLSAREVSVGETSEDDSADEKTAEALKPVNEMSRGELLVEAREYEEIVGENGMKKADLAVAVKAARDSRSGNTEEPA